MKKKRPVWLVPLIGAAILLVVGVGGYALLNPRAYSSHGDVYYPSKCGTVTLDSENGDQYFLSMWDNYVFRQCFVTAVQSHKPTSIAFFQRGIDSRVSFEYAFDGNRLTENYGQGSEADAGLIKSTPGKLDCSGVTVQSHGVVVKCQDQHGQSSDNLFSPPGTPEVTNDF